MGEKYDAEFDYQLNRHCSKTQVESILKLLSLITS